MNDTYCILDSDNNFIVDVVWNLCCALGTIVKLEKLNPSKKFNLRKATLREQEIAHLIQRDSKLYYNIGVVYARED